MVKRTWIWTPVLLIALAGGSYATYRWLTPPLLPEGILYGNGHIEGTPVIVSSQATGRVIASTLVEGAGVRSGQALVRLDDADLKAQLASAEAQRTLALAQLAGLRAQMRMAEHHLANAEADVRRTATLTNQGAMSVEEEEAFANTLAAAREHVGALTAEIAGGAARIHAADDSVASTRLQLERTTVTAPISGTILSKSIEVGELATPGRPVAMLVDLSHLKLKVYVPEQDIGLLRLGDEARVRTDAFPNRYWNARVSRIDQQAQFTPRDIHVPNERVRLVFGVTLALDDPLGWLKPGMPADAWIRWNSATAWPAALVVSR